MAANSYMADAHAQLAFVALELGEAATAAAHMQESRNLLGNSLPAVYLAWLLEGYAGFALAAGRPERAYRLIGAAAALRRTVARAAPLHEQRRLERWLLPARQSLGEEAAMAAQAEGHAMTPERALTSALATEG
ncbi:MAG: hypothetical protein ACR2JY_10840 [Chloroflexota bacterium]